MSATGAAARRSGSDVECRKGLMASGLFIEPKWAQFLQSSGVVEALGRPMPNPLASPGLLDGQGERII